MTTNTRIIPAHSVPVHPSGVWRARLIPMPADDPPDTPEPAADAAAEPLADPLAGRRAPLPTAVYRVIIAVAVLAAAAAIVAGVQATQTGEQEPVTVSGRPDVVEALIPGTGDEVVQQFEVGVDLAPGYEGALTVNGVDIPTEELRLVPQQNQVFFKPSEGSVINELLAGENCVVATVWKSSEGRGLRDQTFQWCFEAS